MKNCDLLFVIQCKVSKVCPSLTVDTVFKSLRQDQINTAVIFRALRLAGIMELMKQTGLLQKHSGGGTHRMISVQVGTVHQNTISTLVKI